MTNDYYTENLADFSYREIEMLRDILDAWVKNGLPEAFGDQGVKAAFNRNSGYIFLVNEDYQTAMMNGSKLEVYHSTPYSGHEGFLSDIVNDYSPDEMHREDIEYILDAAENERFDLPPPWDQLKNDNRSGLQPKPD